MTLQQIISEEERFQFENFTFQDALFLSNHILDKCLHDNGKPVGIQISLFNRTLIYCLMDGKRESEWLNRKAKTVNDSNHSSMFTFISKEDNDIFVEWSQTDEYAICGGGFPITINDIVKGTICVSGREHTEDHALIIDALEALMANKI